MTTILLTLVIFIGVLSIIYAILYNNIQAYNIKINEAESIIDDLLRKKYDNLDSTKNIILKITDLPEQTFEIFNKLKNVNISSFELDRRLSEIFSLIEQIKIDYNNVENDEDICNYYESVYEINERLEAAKGYYNKYTTLLNSSIKKFPTNIIASFHHIKVRTYFDGKDMFDEEIKDFKL